MSSVEQCLAQVESLDVLTVLDKVEAAYSHPDFEVFRSMKTDTDLELVPLLAGVPVPDDFHKPVINFFKEEMDRYIPFIRFVKTPMPKYGQIFDVRMVTAGALIARKKIKTPEQEEIFLNTAARLVALNNIQKAMDIMLDQVFILKHKGEAMTVGQLYLYRVLAMFQARINEAHYLLEENLPQWWKVPELKYPAADIYALRQCKYIIARRAENPDYQYDFSVPCMKAQCEELLARPELETGARMLEKLRMVSIKLAHFKLPAEVIAALYEQQFFLKRNSIAAAPGMKRNLLRRFKEVSAKTLMCPYTGDALLDAFIEGLDKEYVVDSLHYMAPGIKDLIKLAQIL